MQMMMGKMLMNVNIICMISASTNDGDDNNERCKDKLLWNFIWSLIVILITMMAC